MSTADEKFMRMAIAKALEGVRGGQSPFGACIVKDGKVVSCSHNIVWKTTDITAHAEVTAIREACRVLKAIDLLGAVLYSTCEPCPMCFSAIHWAKISKVFFGTCIEDAKALGFGELTIANETMKALGKSPVALAGDFLREESLEVFRLWSGQKNRRVY